MLYSFLRNKSHLAKAVALAVLVAAGPEFAGPSSIFKTAIGEILPAKTTHFYPKPPAGLVMRWLPAE